MAGDRNSDVDPSSDEDLKPSLEDDDDDDDDETLDFISDEDPERKSSACKGTVSYTVLDRDRLLRLQMESIQSVVDILGCSSSTARVLLTFFRWDTEALFGALAERGPELVYTAANVTSRSNEVPSVTGDGGEIECGTCFCDVPREKATAMECGHAFCDDCWRQHLSIQVTDGNARRLPCMAVNCGVICDETKVRRILAGSEELLTKLSKALLESYVDDNKEAKWCPSTPHCGNAIKVDGEPYCEPICSCGTQFCFACAGKPHSPCTCDMWRLWDDKIQGDSENKNWLTANTKPCPKCSNPVEKNGGCNHVSCRCGQHFCWLCGAATGISHTWTNIQGHSCGRFKDEAEQRAESAARTLRRFIHYRDRWEGHSASEKLESEQVETIKQKIVSLEETMSMAKDFTWLMQGLQQLHVARRILGISYVFAFYMFDGMMFGDQISNVQNSSNQNLFEDAQARMESEVERLSGLIETPIEKLCEDGATAEAVRQNIINSSVNIDKRLTNLYDLIENDILGSLQYGCNYIAPYKGESMLRASVAQTVGLRGTPPPSSAAEAVAAEVGASDTIDLTSSPSASDHDPRERPRRGRRAAADGWLGKRAREAIFDRPSLDGEGAHAATDARAGAQLVERLRALEAQLRAADAATVAAVALAARPRMRLVEPAAAAHDGGIDPSDVGALNSANREIQRQRRALERAAVRRFEEERSTLRGREFALQVRPGGQRGEEWRAAALQALMMRQRPPTAGQGMHRGPELPPAGAANVLGAPPPHAAFDMMAAIGEPDEDWTEELAVEHDALLEAIGVRAEPHGMGRVRRDLRARLERLEPAPAPVQQRRPPAVAERLRFSFDGEADDQPPRLVARAAPRGFLDDAAAAAGAAAGADATAAEMDDAAAGGSIGCPVCGAALPLQASNEEVNAHLNQCLAQNRFR